MRQRHRGKCRRAYTLVELSVVLVVVGIIMAAGSARLAGTIPRMRVREEGRRILGSLRHARLRSMTEGSQANRRSYALTLVEGRTGLPDTYYLDEYHPSPDSLQAWPVRVAGDSPISPWLRLRGNQSSLASVYHRATLPDRQGRIHWPRDPSSPLDDPSVVGG